MFAGGENEISYCSLFKFVWEKKTLHVSQQLSMYNVLGKSGIEKNSVKIEEGRKKK